ncbi:MT-A70 family methyltransferase [Sinorhizobium medicae]|uniref:MT-A70 family methyltransferase n=1 Tax=Sinorhizobium medicae TaxID=110321 RepID=UPI001FB3682A|nr:MT-A70 family methyltransferase [Sinorhizobium medicae]
MLIAAKAELRHGEWLAVVEQLPFKISTADKLMAIARDQRLVNSEHVTILPPYWGTVYEIHQLPDDVLAEKFADGTINPECQRADITQFLKKKKRAAREKELATKIEALPAKHYGLILADPEWRFEPYSRESGMDRAADNHYPTSATEIIASRPIAEIAADDSTLALWATVPMLPHALFVMESWGFEYKSSLVWVKDKIGTGYWFRNQHELMLIGTRGDVPAPAMGDQFPSVVYSPAIQHSAKPERVLEILESYFPNIPKIELNRRGPPRKGWDAWGNEVEPC